MWCGELTSLLAGWRISRAGSGTPRARWYRSYPTPEPQLAKRPRHFPSPRASPRGQLAVCPSVVGGHALSSFMNLLRSRSTSSLSTRQTSQHPRPINPRGATAVSRDTPAGELLTVGPLDDVVQDRASRVTHIASSRLRDTVYMCPGRESERKGPPEYRGRGRRREQGLGRGGGWFDTGTLLGGRPAGKMSGGEGGGGVGRGPGREGREGDWGRFQLGAAGGIVTGCLDSTLGLTSSTGQEQFPFPTPRLAHGVQWALRCMSSIQTHVEKIQGHQSAFTPLEVGDEMS